MKVELDVYSDDNEYTLNAEMIDYGVVIRHRGTWNDPAEIEVVEGPEFASITLTDEYGNQSTPHGGQLEILDDLLYDWWYDEVEEDRLCP